MTFDLALILYFCDMLGVAVFAITGGLMAARLGLDILGFLVLGVVTAIGGGTMRDVILDIPVFWVRDPNYLLVGAVSGAVVYFLAPVFQSLNKTLLWLDAAGIALFAVAGAGWAISVDAPMAVVIFMGGLTAVGGGLLRDILGNTVPFIFQREIYALAALAGAAIYAGLQRYGVDNAVAMTIGGSVTFVLRALTICFDLKLPVYKQS